MCQARYSPAECSSFVKKTTLKVNVSKNETTNPIPRSSKVLKNNSADLEVIAEDVHLSSQLSSISMSTDAEKTAGSQD